MIRVALVGLGSVGRGVAGMIAKKDLGISLTGIADSKSGCMDPDGILRGSKNFGTGCNQESRVRCSHRSHPDKRYYR
jgi:glutamate dehydrogenase/leucine dehydrogenase